LIISALAQTAIAYQLAPTTDVELSLAEGPAAVGAFAMTR
jgi:hypothetical protein